MSSSNLTIILGNNYGGMQSGWGGNALQSKSTAKKVQGPGSFRGNTGRTSAPARTMKSKPKSFASKLAGGAKRVGAGASSAWNSASRPVGNFVNRVTSTDEFKGAATGCATSMTGTAIFSTAMAAVGGPIASGGSYGFSCLIGAYAGYFDAAFGEGAGNGLRAIDDGVMMYETYRYLRLR